MNNDEYTDIVIESIEVFLNHILAVRDFYPQQIFQKRRIYNTPIYVSIFPPLNTYLYKVLSTARELIRNGELQRVEMIMYDDALIMLERYVFDICVQTESFTRFAEADDAFMLEFEEQLRSSLYMLAERVKLLEKLPNNTKFKILLHTTQAAFVRLSHDPHYQDFPWLHEALRSETSKRQISLLPLTTVTAVGLQIIAEFV